MEKSKKEKAAEYYLLNKEKFSARAKLYYKKNSKRIKEITRKYKKNNPTKYVYVYHQDTWTKEKRKEYNKKYQAKHSKKRKIDYKKNRNHRYTKKEELYLFGLRWEALKNRIKKEISKIVIDTFDLKITLKDFIKKGITQEEFNLIWNDISIEDRAFIRLRVQQLNRGNIS